MAEWDAEIVVTPELARALIREQFPALGRSIAPLGSGWDNTAYRVDGELVFRFPRRAVAVRLLETESRVLPRIAPHLPLPVPCPAWLGAPSERFPWPFAGYRLLPGRPAASVDLASADRYEGAEPLAAFLRALHAIPLDGLGLPGDEFDRGNFAERVPKLERALRDLRAAAIIDDERPWLRPFEDGGFPAAPPRPALVHGDLYALHILVDHARRVCGVIDWGDVHAGDPGLDLSLLYHFFPAAAREEFLRVYGEVDARTLRFARLRACFHAAMVAHYALDVGDAALLRAARVSMGFVLED